MVNRCNSPGTDIGKPVFMNDPRYILHIDVQISLIQYNTIFQEDKYKDKVIIE